MKRQITDDFLRLRETQWGKLPLFSVIHNSVRQTDSALYNLSLNIHGHVKVPKSKKKKILNHVRQL